MEKRILKKLHKSEIVILDEIVRICKKHDLKYFLIGGTLLGAVRHKGFIPWDDDLDIAMPRDDYEKFIELASKELKEDFILDDISTNPEYWLIFAKVRLKKTVFKANFISDDYEGNNGIWVDIFPLDYSKHNKDYFIKYKWSIIRFLKAIYIRKDSHTSMDKHFLTAVLSIFFKPFNMKKMNNIIKKRITSENSKKEICKYFINYGSQYGVFRQTHQINKIFPLRQLEFENKFYCVPNDYDYVLNNIYGENYMELPPIEKRITHNPEYIKFDDGEEIIFHEKV